MPLIIVAAVAIGLLSARPWEAPQHECVVTVRPGESLQEAIDAAEAGAVICLARGVWTENIVIDKSLTLVGKGGRRTVIEAPWRYASVVEVQGSDDGPVDVRLEGLAISGLGGGSAVVIGGPTEVAISGCSISGRWYGIHVADSASLHLSDSSISETSQRGLVLSGSTQATVSGSRISDNMGVGVWVSGSAGATFVNSEIAGNSGHAFWLRDEAAVVLNDCSVSRNWGHGLWLIGQSSVRVLRSNISGNSDQGIRADDSAVVELTATSISSNWHGVEFGQGATAKVVNCTVSSNMWDGIRVRDSAHATVSGSTISGNRRGVGLSGAAEAEITDCLIRDNSGYGVFSWFEAEVKGAGNEFRGNGMDLGGNLAGSLRAPLREPSETEIKWPDDRYASLQEAVDGLLPGGKLVLEPGTYPAGLTIGTEVSLEAGEGDVVLKARSESMPVFSLVDGADLRLSGVIISGGSTGVALSAGARVVLVGCTVSDNSEGINLSYSSSVEMVDCDIVGNRRGGIFVDGVARATITGCSVSNHGEYGIIAAGSAQVTITGSTVTGTGWDGGVVLWDSCDVVLDGNTIADNRGYGVAVFVHPCFAVDAWPFRGRISGSGNILTANMRGDVCPPELEFLSTGEGGELDLRPQLLV